MKHTITLIPGDGIGPEVAGAVVKIVETAGLEVEWESHLAGVLALERHGSTLPAELLDSIAGALEASGDQRLVDATGSDRPKRPDEP